MKALALRLATGTALSVLALALPVTPSYAQQAAALSGVVAAPDEGPMEGVIVSAQLAGSTMTTSVITDAKGHYAFPAGRLAPGK